MALNLIDIKSAVRRLLERRTDWVTAGSNVYNCSVEGTSLDPQYERHLPHSRDSTR